MPVEVLELAEELLSAADLKNLTAEAAEAAETEELAV